MKRFHLQVYRHTLSYREEDMWIDLKSLEIHPEITQKLADFGIIEIINDRISVSHAGRIKKLMRIRSNLGANLQGAAIILDLLDRIDRLHAEIDELKRR